MDLLWPRGISKEKAQIDEWMKDVAPSDSLRKWFDHKPERWEQFQSRYFDELRSPGKEELVRKLRSMARKGDLTLLFASRETSLNNAAALASFIKLR